MNGFAPSPHNGCSIGISINVDLSPPAGYRKFNIGFIFARCPMHCLHCFPKSIVLSENQRKMHRECLFVDKENATFVGMSFPIRCHLYYEAVSDLPLVVRYPAVWSVYSKFRLNGVRDRKNLFFSSSIDIRKLWVTEMSQCRQL